jgi:hypothetical protein
MGPRPIEDVPRPLSLGPRAAAALAAAHAHAGRAPVKRATRESSLPAEAGQACEHCGEAIEIREDSVGFLVGGDRCRRVPPPR